MVTLINLENVTLLSITVCVHLIYIFIIHKMIYIVVVTILVWIFTNLYIYLRKLVLCNIIIKYVNNTIKKIYFRLVYVSSKPYKFLY